MEWFFDQNAFVQVFVVVLTLGIVLIATARSWIPLVQRMGLWAKSEIEEGIKQTEEDTKEH